MQKDVVLSPPQILELVIPTSVVLVIIGIGVGLIFGTFIGCLDISSLRPKSKFSKILSIAVTFGIIFALCGGFIGGLIGYLNTYGFALPVEDVNNTGWGDPRPVIPMFLALLFSVPSASIGAIISAVILINRSSR